MSGININQFFGNPGSTPGTSVYMPALANAGTNQYVTAANQLYVNTTSSSLIPQSSCNPQLPAALNATNDVLVPGTQVNLSGFQQAANVPASGCTVALVTSASFQSTKGFFVNGTYYLFSPSDAANTIGWISSTDTVNYTPFVAVTPLSGLMIVDMFFNAANSTWYFLEANGLIYSTTSLTTFANGTFYSLPALGVANGYIRLTNINGTWYAVGGSTSSSGYRISSSPNLLSWTVVLENTAGGYPAFNIIQGGGSGATTEILVACSNNTILKSTNNGASFTAVTGVISTAGFSGINNIFYSPRTGLYYIAFAVSTAIWVAVSTTGTLATAGWTTYSTGYNALGNFVNANVNFVDTGTWVGPVYTTTYNATCFFYGTNYNTMSAPIISGPQLSEMDGLNYTSALQGAKAMWLNNGLLVVNSSAPDPYFGSQRTNAMIAVASGATCSTGIAINMWFPISQLGNTSSQWSSWSGISYWNGAYYAGAGSLTYAGSTVSNYTMFLYKLAANLATFSLPCMPVAQYDGISANSTSQFTLSCPMPLASGAGLYWAASQNWNAAYGQQAPYLPVFTYNGAALSSGLISPVGAALTNMASGWDIDGYAIPGQPNGCVTVPKWSSLLNAYVVANPAIGVSGSATGTQPYAAIGTIPSIATSTLTNIATFSAGNPSTPAYIVGLDVMSTGGVVMVVAQSTVLYLSVYFGGVVTQLLTSNYANSGGNAMSLTFAMWEFVSAGTSYLAYAYSTASTNNFLNVWKLSTTTAPTLVVNAYPINNISLGATVTNNLRRVFTINGGFYLGDTAAASPTTRNSLILTPNATGSFSIQSAYLAAPGDATPAGQPNTYTTTNSITTLNPAAAIPSVFVPAGAAGYYLQVR